MAKWIVVLWLHYKFSRAHGQPTAFLPAMRRKELSQIFGRRFWGAALLAYMIIFFTWVAIPSLQLRLSHGLPTSCKLSCRCVPYSRLRQLPGWDAWWVKPNKTTQRRSLA